MTVISEVDERTECEVVLLCLIGWSAWLRRNRYLEIDVDCSGIDYE